MAGDEGSEDGAGNFIRDALGAMSYVRTGARSDSSDGVITFADETEIQLEVTRALIPQFVQASREVEKSGGLVQLRAGSGTWIALLPHDTKVKEFAKLSDISILKYAVEHEMDLSRKNLIMDTYLEGFKVTALSGKPGGEGVLRFGVVALSPNAHLSFSSHPDVIAQFAQSQIEQLVDTAKSHGVQTKFEKLVDRSASAGRSPHFAIVVQETLDTGLRFALWEITKIHGVDTPQVKISLPTGIATMWIVRSDFALAFSYSDATGWQRHSLTTSAKENEVD